MPSSPRLSVLRAHGDAARELSARAGEAATATCAQALRWWLVATMLLLALLCHPGRGDAQLIETTENRIEYQDGGFDLAASFDFDLPPALEDALHKGISLYFVVEFQLTRPRWYWFDDKPVNTTRSVRLSYQPLTRQYRVSTGGLQLPFTRLKSALQFIQQVRGWRVFERNAVKPGETYQAQVRMRLDLSQLPKPFQINAVNTREWNLSSEWRHFNYTVPTNPEAQPVVPIAPPSPPLSPPASPPASSVPPASLPSSPSPGSSPAPASVPASASAPAASNSDARTPFSQTVSTVLSPSQLVQPSASQP
ncbi:DUF4390 domain-containing protein [Cupriavidus plantarum]|uniref:Uncharacterized protein DUF4390 n=1 Tax=Cupriavidus plantarum TaxID=942865 RepID=A0A316F572_9BURK|nr:DUF4390 domain-containing protein [Cupriavidus plantarum]PWK38978.1 uncharacterized protein DUF4390 [Cupriavidus plantarum]REE92608.1 uncharacterized protein DUF4390 [Cupriavidus plantarum]RLK36170.1 uncharacterized protein DUF4390 [Cupriavidus plantarum]CAG2150308.1 hypothetical protein LMG26296_04703 [Cupriavidus plantarum]SMR67974.1 protein of unknown function [Cupriavidus plantarum]